MLIINIKSITCSQHWTKITKVTILLCAQHNRLQCFLYALCYCAIKNKTTDKSNGPLSLSKIYDTEQKTARVTDLKSVYSTRTITYSTRQCNTTTITHILIEDLQHHDHSARADCQSVTQSLLAGSISILQVSGWPILKQNLPTFNNFLHFFQAPKQMAHALASKVMCCLFKCYYKTKKRFF